MSGLSLVSNTWIKGVQLKVELQWASNEVLWEHIRAKCDRSWLQPAIAGGITDGFKEPYA